MTPPRISVVPPAARTAGPQIAHLAAVAGIRLDAAQRMILDAFCGVAADGRWAAFEAAVLQSRQNGKTEALIARILGGLFVLGEQEILFSAHQSRTTAAVFRRLKKAIEGTPELGGRITRVSNRIGAEMIELESGQRLECLARSGGTGRGFSAVPLLVLDEAQYLTAAMMEDVLPALATTNGQILYAMSRGTEESGHLGSLRARALARSPGDRACWLEWSMPEGARVDDPAVWAACNPALAAGRISMDYIRDELAALGPDGFARERLGRSNWPADETGRFAVISREAWEACQDAEARCGAVGVCFGAAVSRDGRTAAIVACGGGRDGLPVLEVADWRPGDGAAWTGPRLADLTRRHDTAAVCWDDDSLAGQLGLAGYIGQAKAITPKPAELAGACGALMFAFEDRAARHTGDVRLTMAVGAAQVRPSRAAWYWDDRTAYGAEVLQAATWALHAREHGRCPYRIELSVA